MSEEIQSEILSEQQIQETVEGKTTEEVVEPLPSEAPDEQLLAGKYKSTEDLVKAYKELEAKLGAKEPPKEEPKPEVDEEYLEYKRNKAQEELLKDLGGVSTYKQATEWARTNLSPEEVTEYNEALAAVEGNEKAIKLLVKGLIEKYKTHNTAKTPPIHSGETTKVQTGAKGYATKSDMMKDMSDPRYERDEGYRQQVAAKLANTDESKWYTNIPRY